MYVAACSSIKRALLRFFILARRVAPPRQGTTSGGVFPVADKGSQRRWETQEIGIDGRLLEVAWA